MINEFLHIESAKPGLTPDILGSVFGMPISNVWVMTWLVGILFIITIVVLNKKLALVPGNFQSVVEMTIEWLDGLIVQVTGSTRAAVKLLPIVGPLFFFLLVSNLIGIIPGLSSISYGGASLFRTVTSDFNMTLTLGLLVSVFIHVSTIAQIGIISFVGKFIQIKQVFVGMKKGAMGGFEAMVGFFVGIMDIIGEIAKVLSMSLRLFGNVYAGEVMTVVFYGLIATLVPAPWHILSSFSGIIQAMVFTMLTIVFYSLAVTES
ncbi:MAG: F0F1 ATP synthase subunit A [Candidatus Magasanikbacteria bacterium]|nr:F0F1 ATP synthase subunit A [Candidatus Magasanikbacteria bacterium]